MSLMFLHIRPIQREDHPFDDMDDDFIFMSEQQRSALIERMDDSLDTTIMDIYNRLGLA